MEIEDMQCSNKEENIQLQFVNLFCFCFNAKLYFFSCDQTPIAIKIRSIQFNSIVIDRETVTSQWPKPFNLLIADECVIASYYECLKQKKKTKITKNKQVSVIIIILKKKTKTKNKHNE